MVGIARSKSIFNRTIRFSLHVGADNLRKKHPTGLLYQVHLSGHPSCAIWVRLSHRIGPCWSTLTHINLSAPLSRFKRDLGKPSHQGSFRWAGPDALEGTTLGFFMGFFHFFVFLLFFTLLKSINIYTLKIYLT